jgi:phospholipase C
MENHSFDNIFGVYPGKNYSASLGIETPTNLISGGSTDLPQLVAVPAGNYSTANPRESVYPEDFDNGKNDGFPRYSGPQSMTYFTSSQLAIEWDWAEQYGLGDNYFSSVLSETTPNRLMSLAGYTPVMSDTGPPPYVPVGSSIFGQLSDGGVSWASYGVDASSYPMNFFSGIENYSSHIHGSWGALEADLSGGSLPSVAFVSSLGGAGVDQHPSDNVTYGEVWLLGIVNEVMRSSYWSSSVIFINYDEGGGYYDQVPPPTLAGDQLGFRVPLIVISPYSKEGYVSHTEMNHASILGFMEYNWHLAPLNEFVAQSYLTLDFFDFSQRPRSPLELNASSTFPMSPQIPFGQLPYARSGSSSSDLASSSSTVAASQNASQSFTSEAGSNSVIPSSISGFTSWLSNNSTLVLSGIGVVVLGLVLSAVRRMRR